MRPTLNRECLSVFLFVEVKPMRVVLKSKVILADRLTMDQASSLIRQIREREATAKIFDNTIYMESVGNHMWRVTVHMPYVKDFIENPRDFVFEV
jgi:hypothetical protein